MTKFWKILKIVIGSIALVGLGILLFVLGRKNGQGTASPGGGRSVNSVANDLAGQAGRVDGDLADIHASNRDAIDLAGKLAKDNQVATGVVDQLTDANRRLAKWISDVSGDG